MLFGKIGGIYEWITVVSTISGFNTTTTYNTSRSTTTTFNTSRSTQRFTSFNTNRSTTTAFQTIFQTRSPVTFNVITQSGTKDLMYYGWISDGAAPNVEIAWNSVLITIVDTSSSGPIASYTVASGETYYKEVAQYTAGDNQYFSVSRDYNTSRFTSRNTTTTFSTTRLTTATTTFSTTRSTTTIFSTSRSTVTGNPKNTDRVTKYYE